MKKIRYYFATIALAVALIAPALGIAAGSLANTASQHVASGTSTRAVAFIKPWCPIPGALC